MSPNSNLNPVHTGPSYPIGTVGTVPRAYELTRGLRNPEKRIYAVIGQ